MNIKSSHAKSGRETDQKHSYTCFMYWCMQVSKFKFEEDTIFEGTYKQLEVHKNSAFDKKFLAKIKINS
jgi:hypothetical protein